MARRRTSRASTFIALPSSQLLKNPEAVKLGVGRRLILGEGSHSELRAGCVRVILRLVPPSHTWPPATNVPAIDGRIQSCGPTLSRSYSHHDPQKCFAARTGRNDIDDSSLVVEFRLTLLNVLQDLVLPVRLFSSFTYAFACFSVMVFFFVFHRAQQS